MIAFGQSAPSPDDNPRGYIQAFLEDNLSGAGRDVRITGFTGALSARATIDELSIADAKGVWITLKNITLDWDRTALLRGVIDITELTAKEVSLPRAPVTTGANGLPIPEASGFSLPELPVSVRIAKFGITKIAVGADILGRDAVFSLKGSAKLEGGAGTVDFGVTRTDGPLGTFALKGSFSNTTRQLSVNLDVAEGPNGIATNLLDLPGKPAVELQIQGNGPINDFAASVALRTDGQDRLTGRVALVRPQPTTADVEAPLRFFAEIGGDIAPVFTPQYRNFFGPDIRLILRGEQAANGATHVTDFSLRAAAINVQGALDLSGDHWLERIVLKGVIAAPDNAPVLLPLSGPQTRITRATFDAEYDRALGDGWRGDVTLTNLRRALSGLQQAKLTGTGTITPGDGALIGKLDGRVTLGLQGLELADPASSRALGRDLSGGAHIDWSEGSALNISSFALTGPDYSLLGSGTFGGVFDGLQIDIQGSTALTAANLARFDALSGLPLSGAAQLQIDGRIQPLAGTFDAQIRGMGRDIGIGQPLVDPLIQGNATLATHILRDETGTRLNGLTVKTDATSLRADAHLRSEGSSLSGQLDLRDVSIVIAGANGPASVSASATQTGPSWELLADATGPGGLDVKSSGILSQAITGDWLWHGDSTSVLADASPYSPLAGRRLSGGLQVTAQGDANISAQTVELAVQATTRDIAITQRYVDTLMRGQGTITTNLSRSEKKWRLDSAAVKTPQMSAAAEVSLADDGTTLATIDGLINDIGLFASGVQGALAVKGTAKSIAQGWQIDANATGPGTLAGVASGTASSDGQQLNLKLDGTAPMALADQFIAPRRAGGTASYDLRVSGPAQLSSVSGTIILGDGGISLPNLRMSLDKLAGNVQLSAGQARIALRGVSSTGGSFNATGPVSLSAPYQADLALAYTDIGAREPGVFDTTLSGQLRLAGPLLGAASLTGTIDLGRVEMRIADGHSVAIGSLPGLKHVNEPAAVKRTRTYAGLIDTSANASNLPVFTLDILVRAPGRIFIRGRGLDAELGGQLRLAGTTKMQIPQGRFDLVRGRLDLLGRRLDLSQGYVTIRGDSDAYMNLIAESQVDTTLAQVLVEGLVSDPQISFSSVPDLPEDEVLSLLLFGRGLGKVSPLQAVQLATAIATLAGKGGDGIINKLRKRFGLDDLDVSTTEDGTTKARVGKYISDKAYADATVDSAGKAEINLNIILSPNVTAKGRLGSDGSTGLGVYFEKDY